jgi:hypothetical protein
MGNLNDDGLARGTEVVVGKTLDDVDNLLRPLLELLCLV